MTRRNTLLIAASLLMLVIAFLLWSANKANKESDRIMASFKNADSAFKALNDSLTKKNIGTGAIIKQDTGLHKNELSAKTKNTLALIEDMKTYLQKEIDNKSTTATPGKKDIKALKAALQDYNFFIMNNFNNTGNLKEDDLINIANVKTGNTYTSWEDHHFQNGNTFAYITVLNATKEQLLKLYSKVVQDNK